MRELATVLPRKLQEVPGVLQGGIGWQGIVPARAAKMGSIAVDKAIAKLGTPGEFYQQLEPEQIAEHIVTVFRPEIPELVDEVMRQDHPRLWRDLPGPVRGAVVERVQAQLPTVVGRVTDEIGIHIDQLLDPKIMVIDHFRDQPALVVRIFRDFGQRGAQPDGARSGSCSASCSASRWRSSTTCSGSGGCCRSSASSSAGSPTRSACG